MRKNNILLIYPRMGMSGALVRHMPLSLIYAAADSVKTGFDVEILDLRLVEGDWKTPIANRLKMDTLLVGISVMTGTPVTEAINISRWLREISPDLPIVWGGPFVQFNGIDAMQESTIDFVISGYGSRSLSLLSGALADGPGSLPLDKIPGLIYRDETTRELHCNPQDRSFEIMDYRDIPYHLVEDNLPCYGQLDNPEQVFPMYATLGCPYNCAFCSSPASYAAFSKRYHPLPIVDVVDHVEYVNSRYGATYIYFIDDDSFADLQHVEAIIDEISRRKLPVKLGFRGARINEVLQMDDAYLSKLASAGTTILHIGAESGSQRMLDLMNKNISVGDIVKVNRMLAGHPEITPAYNWIVGLPGETEEDLAMTRDLVLQLIDENPSTIIFAPNTYRPLPGTELFALAVKYGYSTPEKLEEWGKVEVEGDFRPPWYSARFAALVRMMLVASYFIDNKLAKVTTGDTLKFKIARAAGRLYAPLAKFRYRHGVTAFLFEYPLFRFFANRL